MRKLLALLHLWAGLILAGPLVLLGLTGSVLVFEHELDGWMNPALYRASDGPARPIAEIVAAAEASGGGERLRAGVVSLPEEAGGPAIVRVAPGGARGGPGGGPGARQVFVDPASLAILGSRDPMSTGLRQIFLLHANATVRDRSGREVVGWLGVAMLGLGLTGLYLWWPRPGRWRQAFRVKAGTGTYRFNRDLHGAVGIWAWLVFVIVSFSGVFLAFPQALGGAITSVFPGRDLRASANEVRATPVPGERPMTLDAAVGLAREAVPNARAVFVMPAGRPEQPVRVGLRRDGQSSGGPAITVFVDPFAKTILEVRDPRTFTLGETITAWQHALHEGAGLGPVWKALVFLSGFLPLLFVVTGLTMWLKKRQARRAAPAATVEMPA